MGWAIGLASCLLIGLYVMQEHAYDRFYSNADHIYRIVTDIRMADDVQHLATSSGAIAPVLRTDLPEVREVVRLREATLSLEHSSGRYQEVVYFADSTFFSVFDFPLELGREDIALKGPASAVLTASAAAKYFGEVNPVGQSLTLEGQHALTVTGVLAALPDSSHLNFDVLVSMQAGEVAVFPGELENWGMSPFYTYMLLRDRAAARGMSDKLADLVERQIGPLMRDINVYLDLSVEPLSAIYLQSERAQQIGSTGSALNVYAFATLGLFILLISSLNVINLTVARMTDRMREAGVRKALGASRRQLLAQFIGESVLLALIGASLGLGIAALAVPGFNDLSGAQLSASQLIQPKVLFAFLLLSASVGVFSGMYPAFLFAQSKVTHALRGALPLLRPQRNAYRGLVALQFGLAAALMACTAVVYVQLRHMQEVDLGFESAQTLIVDYQGAHEVNGSLDVLKAELLRHPNIQGASASRLVPGEQVRRTSVNIQQQEGAGSDVRQVVDYRVDHAFIEQYGLELLAGRPFAEARSTDATSAVVINEAMARMLHYGEPSEVLGAGVEVYESDGPVGAMGRAEIIGVVRNFHVTSMHEAVEPLMLRIDPEAYRFLAVRIAAGGVRSAMQEVERVFGQVVPESALLYRFLDDRFNAQYQSDVQFGRTFAASAILALILACLGLNGMSANTALRRRREVGIRKTFGASVSSLIALLSKELLVLVAIGLIIALPLAYVLMQQWLANFAYRVSLGFGLFAVVALCALVMAGLAVSYQAARAARTNPIQALGHQV
ncbi:MAG: ABC transporter permease [Rhodothermales bacterium]